MSQEIEIEFKNLLTYHEFVRLTDEFGISQNDFKEQTNYYFDSLDFKLKQHKSALRVRIKSETYTLTLKQQYDQHILETHQVITKDIFTEMIEGQPLPSGEVAEAIKKLDIDGTEITFLGELMTLRVELPYKDGLLVLDENHYLGKIDYEIEYESADYKVGLKSFDELLHSMQIPRRETASKVGRFFAEKNVRQ